MMMMMMVYINARTANAVLCSKHGNRIVTISFEWNSPVTFLWNHYCIKIQKLT